MITPTRTVCYVRMLDGSLKDVSEARSLAHLWGWDFTNVKRVVVREEPVEQYHPLMFHTSELPALEIKPGEVKRYPLYDSFLGSLSCLRPIEMPKDSFQKMYLGEWVNEE